MTRRAFQPARAAWGVSPSGELRCASRRGAGSAGVVACRSGSGTPGGAARARTFSYPPIVTRAAAPVRFGTEGARPVRPQGARRALDAADPAAPTSK